MIYEFPNPDAPICQGDIFVGLPRVEISLKSLTILGENDSTELVPWNTIVQEGKEISAILGVKPVAAIVATQDCDTLRSPDITLCEIRDFQEVERRAKDCKTPASWMRTITQHARMNLKWFYLPPDARVGFVKKMAADFLVTIRVPRQDLWEHRHLRRGRLIHEADEHFRERLAEFFRRYPYDEWYPLDQNEFSEYAKANPETPPRVWQAGSPSAVAGDHSGTAPS